MKSVLLAIVLLMPVVGDTGCPPGGGVKRIAGPLKFSDLTVDRAQQFRVLAPFSVTIPAGVGFVITDAGAPGNPVGVSLQINGVDTAGIPSAARNFDPPIVARTGDVVSIVASQPIMVDLGGYVCTASEVALTPPASPTLMKLSDFTLDRTHHFVISGSTPSWSVTAPPTGLSLVLVNWYDAGSTGLTYWIIDGVVATATEAGKLTAFRAPIVVRPGQTLTLASNLVGGSINGEIGGYVAFSGEV